MAQEWITLQRDSISRYADGGNPTPFQEYSISLLDKLLIGALKPSDVVPNDITYNILESDQTPLEAWYDFLNIFFSAASWTSDSGTHGRLVGLVFAFANYTCEEGASARKAEIDELIKNLAQFQEITRTNWNGPSDFEWRFGPGEKAQRAWVNLNQFIALLSNQQRKTPTPKLNRWLEDFGLWNIAEGLEDKEGMYTRSCKEPAAIWIQIAGKEIYKDPNWGQRERGEAGEGVPVREGDLWIQKQRAGATEYQRWGFWRERLASIASDESYEAAIRESAAKAEKTMAEIEAAT